MAKSNSLRFVDLAISANACSRSSSFGLHSRVRTALVPNEQHSNVPVIAAHQAGITAIWHKIGDDQISSDWTIGCGIRAVSTPSSKFLDKHFAGRRCPIAFRDNIVLACACADASIKILLVPREAQDKPALNKPTLLTTIHVAADLLSVAWTAPLESDQSDAGSISLLIAAVSQGQFQYLTFSRITFEAKAESVTISQGSPTFQKLLSPGGLVSVSFNPSIKNHNHIMLATEAGQCYIYDPFSTRTMKKGLQHHTTGRKEFNKGAWLASFTIGSTFPVARRLLGAAWLTDGSAIIALLNDGSWGAWDVAGVHSQSSADGAGSFAIRGSIGSSVPSHMSQKSNSKRIEPKTSALRKSDAGSLFVESSEGTTRKAAKGGITIISSITSAADFVTFWYAGTVCYIDNFQSYWSRASNRSAETKLQTVGGSLFGPAVARLQIFDDLGGQEMVAALTILPSKDSINHQQTIAVASEYGILFKRLHDSRISASAAATDLMHRPGGRPEWATADTSRSLPQLDAILDSMELS